MPTLDTCCHSYLVIKRKKEKENRGKYRKKEKES